MNIKYLYNFKEKILDIRNYLHKKTDKIRDPAINQIIFRKMVLNFVKSIPKYSF